MYAPTDTGRHWTTKVPYREVGRLHQYLTAYHWALSQMTSGAMGMQAENTSERAFNVAVLIIGVVLSSAIISRLTAKLAEYSALSTSRDTH